MGDWTASARGRTARPVGRRAGEERMCCGFEADGEIAVVALVDVQPAACLWCIAAQDAGEIGLDLTAQGLPVAFRIRRREECARVACERASAAGRLRRRRVGSARRRRMANGRRVKVKAAVFGRQSGLYARNRKWSSDPSRSVSLRWVDHLVEQLPVVSRICVAGLTLEAS